MLDRKTAVLHRTIGGLPPSPRSVIPVLLTFDLSQRLNLCNAEPIHLVHRIVTAIGSKSGKCESLRIKAGPLANVGGFAERYCQGYGRRDVALGDKRRITRQWSGIFVIPNGSGKFRRYGYSETKLAIQNHFNLAPGNRKR